MSSIEYVRLFADASGGSHIERGQTIDLASADFVPPAPSILVSAVSTASGYAFLVVPAGYFGEWHPSPKRQWIIFLSGEMEFETTDGARHVGKPGLPVLLEDVSGRGHQSRVPATQPAVMMAIQI